MGDLRKACYEMEEERKEEELNTKRKGEILLLLDKIQEDPLKFHESLREMWKNFRKVASLGVGDREYHGYLNTLEHCLLKTLKVSTNE